MKKLTTLFAVLTLLTSVPAAHASLIAYYDFEGNTLDQSGNGNDGTNFGATLTTGKDGQGYTFDGVNDFIQVNLDVNPNVLPQLTWGAWVNADTASGIRKVLSHDNSGFDRTLGIDSRTGGTWSTFTGNTVAGTYSVNTGTWQFIAAVYDESVNQAILYVDGASQVFATNFGLGHAFLRIGSNPSFGEYFDGIIDNVFIYNEALTVADLDNIRRNGIGGSDNSSHAVPEPATMMLFGTGLIGAAIRRKLS